MALFAEKARGKTGPAREWKGALKTHAALFGVVDAAREHAELPSEWKEAGPLLVKSGLAPNVASALYTKKVADIERLADAEPLARACPCAGINQVDPSY